MNFIQHSTMQSLKMKERREEAGEGRKEGKHFIN